MIRGLRRTVCWPMFVLPKEIKRVSSEIYETADGLVYLNLSFFLELRI